MLLEEASSEKGKTVPQDIGRNRMFQRGETVHCGPLFQARAGHC